MRGGGVMLITSLQSVLYVCNTEDLTVIIQILKYAAPKV
jgi:hypothetical protein